MNLAELLRSVALGGAAFCLSLTPVLAAEYMSVSKDGINLRSAPKANAEVLFELPAGYPLEVLGKEGQWFKVQDYEGDKGYIHESTVSKSPHVIVKVKECKIRSGPSTSDQTVGSAVKDAIFTRVEQKGDWIKISHPDVTGWIHKDLVWP